MKKNMESGNILGIFYFVGNPRSEKAYSIIRYITK